MESVYKYNFQNGKIESRARIEISMKTETRIFGVLHTDVCVTNPDGVSYCNSFVIKSQLNLFLHRKDKRGFNVSFLAENLEEAEIKAQELWNEYLKNNFVVEIVSSGKILVSKGNNSILVRYVPHKISKPENGGKSLWRIDFGTHVQDFPSKTLAIDYAKEFLESTLSSSAI